MTARAPSPNRHRYPAPAAAARAAGCLALISILFAPFPASLAASADLLSGTDIVLKKHLAGSKQRDLPDSETAGGSLALTALRREGGLITLLDSSLRAMGETLTPEGTLSLPLPTGETLKVDARTSPVAGISTGRSLLLDFDGDITEESRRLIEEHWPRYRVINVPADADFRHLMGLILDESGYHSVSRDAPLFLGRHGRVRIVPDFLVAPTAESILDGSLMLIMIEDSPNRALPSEIKEIARDHLVKVVEITPPSGGDGSPVPASFPGWWGGGKITASDFRTLLGELGPALGLKVREALPTDGEGFHGKDRITLEGNGRSRLVTFVAAEADRTDSLTIAPDDSLELVLARLLHTFGYDYSGPFLEFYQPGARFTILIEGYYIARDTGPLVVTGDDIGPRLKAMLAGRGIEVITCLLPEGTSRRP